MNDIEKTNAFTLAEVLITLGIIGIVSALTMPTLIQNGQEKALETATQKFYNTFQTAVDNYMQLRGLTDMSQMDSSMIEDFVTNSFKKASKMSSCSATFSGYKALTGSVAGDFGASNKVCYKLNDGTIVGFEYGNKKLSIIADINGSKGPNQVGRDFWALEARNKGEICEFGEPDGSESSSASCGSYACGGSSYYGNSYYGNSYYGSGSSGSSYYGSGSVIDENFQKCKSGATYYGCFTHLRLNDFKFDY